MRNFWQEVFSWTPCIYYFPFYPLQSTETPCICYFPVCTHYTLLEHPVAIIVLSTHYSLLKHPVSIIFLCVPTTLYWNTLYLCIYYFPVYKLHSTGTLCRYLLFSFLPTTVLRALKQCKQSLLELRSLTLNMSVILSKLLSLYPCSYILLFIYLSIGTIYLSIYLSFGTSYVLLCFVPCKGSLSWNVIGAGNIMI